MRVDEKKLVDQRTSYPLSDISKMGLGAIQIFHQEGLSLSHSNIIVKELLKSLEPPSLPEVPVNTPPLAEYIKLLFLSLLYIVAGIVFAIQEQVIGFYTFVFWIGGLYYAYSFLRAYTKQREQYFNALMLYDNHRRWFDRATKVWSESDYDFVKGMVVHRQTNTEIEPEEFQSWLNRQ